MPKIGERNQTVRITAHSLATCLGRGRAAHLEALRVGRSGLTPCDYPAALVDCFIGRVAGIEDDPFPAAVAAYDNRATRLLLAALAQDGMADDIAACRDRWGAARIGVVLGTSTSGVEALEICYRKTGPAAPMAPEYSLRHHNDHHAVSAFLQAHLDVSGPAYAISTACSSSAKALIDAMQLIEAGVCDAVVAGGVDSLCLTSLNGFEGLQLISRQPSRPCDAGRDGLSIGEGAALMLVERDAEHGPRLSGWGESSDGINMSTPPEDGAGAAAAMRAALDRAGLAPSEIGYVNLHGTATRSNDAAEGQAVNTVLGPDVPASSMKGAIGHTLGAAGAVEASLSLIAMEAGLIPANTGLSTLDPAIACNVSGGPREARYRHLLSNAFGFGGNNAALVLSL